MNNLGYPFTLSLLIALLLFGIAIGVFIYRDRKRVKPNPSLHFLVGKNAVVMDKSFTDRDGYHYYQIKIGGEFWKARSHTLYKVGEDCMVCNHIEDGMLLEI